MAEIDPVILELRADLGKYRADLQSTTSQVQRLLGNQEKSAQRLEAQMRKSSGAIGASLRGLAGTLGTYFTGRELTGLIDSFTRLQNSLRVAGLEGAKLESVQSQLLDLSTRYGVGIEGLANLYGKATDAGRSFGASEAEILQLTEATSQALLITGTSAAQAQGAILGLSQALASGTVRAEEYNQINEGGLRPLLQAAAASERFGGDINKLRAAMLDGKVSSQEFFGSILAGSAQLEGQASKAALTLAGAFEALTSRLTVYIGQSAQANGATQAIAGALQTLADNLDTIIPLLAIIGTALGVGFVTNAVRARIAALAAAGAMTTLAGAARAALAFLGGPVGLAITAVTVGLGYMAAQSIDTAASVGELESELAAAEARLADAAAQAKAAGIDIENLGSNTDGATNSLSTFTDVVWASVNAMTSAANAAKELTLAKIALSSAEARSTIAELAPKARGQAAGLRGAMALGPGILGKRFDQNDVTALNETSARLNLAAATLRANEQTRKLIEANPNFKEPTANRTPTAATDKAKPGPKPKSGPVDRSEDIARRFQDEVERGLIEIEALVAESRNNAQEISATQISRIRAEQAIAARAINADKDLDQAQKERLLQINDLIAAAQISVENAREQARLDGLTTDAMRDETDALRAEAGLVDIRKERVAIERRILEIQQEIERKLLDEAIARGDVLDAAKARALLDRRQSAETAGFERDNQGPLADYFDRAKRDAADLNEAYQQIAVDGLGSVTDALTETATGFLKLGGTAGKVIDGIISDLIRLFIQQQITGLFGSIFGGGTTGAVNKVAGATVNFGRIGGLAGGGYAEPGSLHRVNEHKGGVELLRMGSQGGQVIPLGAVNAQASRDGGQSGGVVRIIVEEGPGFASTVRAEAAGVAVEVVRATAPSIIQGAVGETQRQMSRPRMPGAGR